MAKLSKRLLGVFVAVCMLASLFTCLMGMPVSAESADMLSFDGTNAYGCVAYTTSWADIPAGDYRFEMDCLITSGTPVCYPCGRVWNSGDDNAKFNNRNYTYDEANRKYIVTFNISSDISGNFSMYIGNYDGALDGSGDAVFACAHPKLYSIDEAGNATEASSIIKYDFNTYTNTKDISSSTTHKWRRLSSAGVTRSEIPDGFFDPVTVCTHESKHLVEAVDSTCTTHGHDDYYACDNCDAIFNEQGDEITLADVEWELDPEVHEDELPVAAVASTCKTQGHTAYIACSGCGAIISGSNDPLPLDPNNHAGEGTELRDVIKATDHSTGYSGDTYCLGCGEKIAEGEETPVIIRKMLHFFAGEDGWQTMVYKLGGTFAAGTYRFTIDENAKTGVQSTAKLFVNGSAYTTSVEVVSDELDTENNKRTVKFILYGTKPDGALILIGNYGNGDNMETYYANPELYLLDDEGNPTGENLIGDFTADNIVLKTGTSRSNADVDKWTSLNWNSSKVQVENYNPTVFGADCSHYVKVPVEEKASTCTTPGNIAYVACEACGAYFDAEGNELTSDQVLLPLDPKNHEGEGTEKRDYVKATRTSDGYTGDIYCKGCGVCIEQGEPIYSGSWASKMITWGEGAMGYSRVMYRPAEGAFEAGATYRYSFDMEIDEAEANEDNYWKIFYRTDTQVNWTTDFAKIPLNFETDVVKTPLTHGYHYEVTFTVPDECLAEDNVLITFGDRNMENIPPLMRFANLDLWKLDGEGNKTEQIILDLPAILEEIIPTSDGFKKLCADKGEWYTVENYNTSLDLVEQNGYFAPLEGCDHANTYTLGAVAATCSAVGHTGTVYCADCHAIVSEDAEIPFADHTVGEWLSDDTYHWHYCSVCEGTLDQAEHSYEWV
ncbi:MAG: hypothetical protein IKZ59_00030, partial [Clostridia bacterium]|nr:hypothetical protein [Clostridia bacterium]